MWRKTEDHQSGFKFHLTCNLCGDGFIGNSLAHVPVTGIMKYSNGRHIVNENTGAAKAHICFKCIESIQSEECNFKR